MEVECRRLGGLEENETSITYMYSKMRVNWEKSWVFMTPADLFRCNYIEMDIQNLFMEYPVKRGVHILQRASLKDKGIWRTGEVKSNDLA